MGTTGTLFTNSFLISGGGAGGALSEASWLDPEMLETGAVETAPAENVETSMETMIDEELTAAGEPSPSVLYIARFQPGEFAEEGAKRVIRWVSSGVRRLFLVGAQTPGDAEPDIMAELFPNLGNPHIMQRNVDDCFILAYLHALAKKPYGRHTLSKLIKRSEDHWIVSFADSRKDIHVYHEDLAPRHHGQFSLGDLGFRIIEAAFEKKRSAPFAIKGGYMHDISTAIMGNMASRRFISVNMLNLPNWQAAFVEFEANRNFVTLNAGTTVKISEEPPFWFVPNHMYNIISVNFAARTVTISNPYGSELLVTEISFKDFAKFFVDLGIETVDPVKVRAFIDQ